ncbi:hypothetical protein LJC68_05105 [Bacteroidales bacterium OttesenSCG-928-B11]|nr:hypothetical protein [Bacteroidales bacterium OttesenSCG-928-C03]MDL2312235.1 hypothetical protein [Bacteroidales bacterium OttesenSCG-928-B11]MDL2326985.1 hypothetical protein [Bacteroidales bacterium OttesenSCG-928-A14]
MTSLFYFNPGHEMAVLNGSPYYHQPEVVLKMQQDLGYLPAWLAKADDWVYVNDDTIREQAEKMRNFFPTLPKPITHCGLPHLQNVELACWGISPQVIHFFKTLNEEWSSQIILPEWKEEYRHLTSRQASHDCLRMLIRSIPGISPLLLPQCAKSISEIEQMIVSNKQPLLIKSPYSSSGRGLLWLRDGLHTKERELLNGMLKKQGSASVEPIFNKKLDFSMQFLADGKGNISFGGYSIFSTNKKGAYLGSYIHSQENCITQISSFISMELLDCVRTSLSSILQQNYASTYKGCLGVDMMVYEANGQYHIHPCVEINMRYSMGFLSIELQKRHIAPQSSGFFSIDYFAKEGDAFHHHLTMQQQHPLEIVDKKVKKGYFSLCPVSEKTKYLAGMVV